MKKVFKYFLFGKIKLFAIVVRELEFSKQRQVDFLETTRSEDHLIDLKDNAMHVIMFIFLYFSYVRMLIFNWHYQISLKWKYMAPLKATAFSLREKCSTLLIALINFTSTSKLRLKIKPSQLRRSRKTAKFSSVYLNKFHSNIYNDYLFSFLYFIQLQFYSNGPWDAKGKKR